MSHVAMVVRAFLSHVHGAAVFALAAVPSPAIAQAVDLDLTHLARPVIAIDDPEKRVEVRTQIAGHSTRNLDVAVRLLEINPASCEWHARIRYVVEIRNTGRSAV